MSSALTTLLRSDVDYFQLGARNHPLPGGSQLWWMDGCQKLPSGCVAFGMESVQPGQADSWIDALETSVRDAGSMLSRLYLQRDNPALELALTARGYKAKTEIAFLGTGPTVPGSAHDHYRLRPIAGDRHWDEALRVFIDGQDGPDGYQNPPALWLDFIQRKVATGRLAYFLIESDSGVVGTLGKMFYPDLLRLKNLLIRPGSRMAGAGAAATLLTHEYATVTSGRTTGVFGIEGSAGAAVYSSTGMRPAGRQTEWTRWLIS
ncbi:MAG: hypothetical protein KIT83_07915 [Bryobacterales bacterium]|nr:hypothetical protein [Bryobacterales bacterium]